MFIPDPDLYFFTHPGSRGKKCNGSWIRNTTGKLSPLHFLIVLGKVPVLSGEQQSKSTSAIDDQNPAFDLNVVTNNELDHFSE